MAVGGLWLALLAAAVMLSMLAASNDTLPGDGSITEWVQSRPLPGHDLSEVIRTVTGTEVVLATGAFVVLVLWLRRCRRRAVLLAAGLTLLAVAQPFLKELVDRPRPDAALVEVRAGYSSTSFPSGHVMSGSLLYGFLLYLSLTLPVVRAGAFGFGIICAAIVGLAGPANVWLGVHWPSDVLGSWLWCSVILVPLFIADRLGKRAP